MFKYTWNTPSIQLVVYHFKHNHRKEVLGAAGIESTPVRSVDNNRAAKHEATMLVCLMFSCLFF